MVRTRCYTSYAFLFRVRRRLKSTAHALRGFYFQNFVSTSYAGSPDMQSIRSHNRLSSVAQKGPLQNPTRIPDSITRVPRSRPPRTTISSRFESVKYAIIVEIDVSRFTSRFREYNLHVEN